MNGYQRIIFFDYGGGAYFLDQRSRRLWDPKAVADEDEDSIFLDIFQEDDGVELFQKEEEETDTSQILSIQLSAEEMLRNIGPLLLDVSIPTAVVFTNGTAALKLFVLLEHGQLLDDFLQKITQSTLISVNNRNTAIFCLKVIMMKLLMSLLWSNVGVFFKASSLLTIKFHCQIVLR